MDIFDIFVENRAFLSIFMLSQGFASGMNDYVAKPIDMNVLLMTIIKYI